ncbi:MAG: hypothetical protein RBU37_22285 [Myxococcota bacterium]|nr:hypothetical protein [Myxococcota bacterium]
MRSQNTPESELARQRFEALRAAAPQWIPGFELRFSDESAMMARLSRLMKPLLRLDLRQNFVALYPRVYFPNRAVIEAHPELAFKALAHELVHLWDMRQRRLRFAWGYLSPQLWALASLLALATPVCPWALLNLAWLLALAPWPAPWRVTAELRGYLMDASIQYWTTNTTPTPRALVSLFTGWSYYRMAWNGERIEQRFEEAYARLRRGELPCEDRNEVFDWVRRLLHEPSTQLEASNAVESVDDGAHPSAPPLDAGLGTN